MPRILFTLLLTTFMLVGTTVTAQSGGQFCVRAFEDVNANGQIDPGENLLTRGINVNLLDANNVTIASALLDQSPTAAQGVVCFQFLAAGQYTISITSAEFQPTTPASITTSISDSGVPEVVEFGARSITAAATAPAAAGETSVLPDENQIIRILLAGLGALVVIIGLSIVGMIIYAVAFRRRPLPPPSIDPRRTTGSIPAVKTPTTGSTPKV